MTEPFMHYLHIIYAQVNSTYTIIQFYNLKTYLQLKSIKILKTNKNTLN